MTQATLFLYALASFSVTVIPGPTTLLALANGTSRNWRVAGMGIVGAALSDLLLIGAVSIGLGALLAASETLFSLVKWVGVCYLIWLGIQLWRSKQFDASGQSANESASPMRAFVRSLAVALSNPKGLLFFSAFLPQFINISQPQAIQYLQLALLSTVIDIVVMTCYAAGGSQAAKLLTSRGLRRLNRGCASVMLSLAAFLALYRKTNA